MFDKERRRQESHDAMRNFIRAELCRKTPIVYDVANNVAKEVATMAMNQLEQNKTYKLIQQIQIAEIISEILQARHDVTFNEAHMNNPDSALYWYEEAKRANNRLHVHLRRLAVILGMEETMENFIQLIVQENK